MALSKKRSGRIGPNCFPAARSFRSPVAESAGFTLAEFLVAAALFGIMALALGRGIMVTITSDRQAGEQSRAVALAVDKMERLKAVPSDQVVTESPRQLGADGTEGSGPYRRWVDVAAEGDYAKSVTVHVEYPTGREKRRVTLRTMIYAPK
jgi:prepilin-type N-terminal cleavage/methylation domain-containing protein